MQVNIFAGQAPRILEFLAKDGSIDKISLPRLYRASILFDPARRIVEVVAQGGRLVRDGLVEAFRTTLLPDGITTDRLVRREIDFQLFRSKPDFRIEPEDPISAVIVDEVRLFPPDSKGGLVTSSKSVSMANPVTSIGSRGTGLESIIRLARPAGTSHEFACD